MANTIFYKVNARVGFNPICPGLVKHITKVKTGGLGGVGVPIIFGNDLLWNDLPYLKGFMKFGCLEP